ncbi:MAG: PEP-utilizing enzyme [Candidatus Poribacteria bacterium]|nr:PEP-utilizing enzyme [Candidatus Poribacteria bacterium]
MQFIKHFSEIDATDLSRVGGKGLNLGKLTRAGFRVPQGFCVTTDAYLSSVQDLPEQNVKSIKELVLVPELVTEIRAAYEKLQTATVAVRSSATAEDLAEASFAGQQDTFLNVTSDELLEALKACWASLWLERAIAYRETHGIADEGLAMAVVIQEMCEADASGVLFTVSPFSQDVSIVESNWGLGESVVSGAITPDSFQVSRETGEILEKTVATKREMVTASGISEVAVAQQDTPSLTETQLRALTQLGLRVESHYGQPMDIEWALADGQFVLLQARYITTSSNATTPFKRPHPPPEAAEEVAENLRQGEIHLLKIYADAHGTVWCHHNIAEVLPAPQPMTWSIIRKFMSGSGGLGKAYRSLGFYPSKRVDSEGILDLVCGRIYVNLNREAELHFDGFPFAHDFNALKQNPQQAMYAQAVTDITRSTTSFWLKLPLHVVRMSKAEMRLRQCRSDFDQVLTTQVFPAFQSEVEAEWDISYSNLSDTELVGKFRTWCTKTLDDFAPKALTATLLAGFSLQRLEGALQKCVDETAAKSIASRLISGLSGNLTVETNDKLQQVALRDLSLTDFLKDYGHRAVDEFELAQPRWREDATYLEQIVESFRRGEVTSPTQTDGETLKKHPSKNPLRHSLSKEDRAEQQMEQRESAEVELVELVKNKSGLRKQIESELEFTRRYMPFRETAKFYLMLGYEQIRRALIELDCRYALEGGIFYLVPDELRQLINGKAFNDIIATRKMERELLLQIEVPDVIFSDSLEQIGTPMTPDTAETYRGVSVSAGVATGKARVLLTPADVHPSDRDYILVCPSTDPAWTPLFLHAAGLVMERGGILSHGAVVAREYGVPAVVNIPNATRHIADGQLIQIDGNAGTVSILTEIS